MSELNPLHVTRFTATSCLGQGVVALQLALEHQRSGLAPCHFETARIDTYIGIRLPQQSPGAAGPHPG
jgi:3-oxoacyl-[acyl-carrier-protein] synthase-1